MKDVIVFEEREGSRVVVMEGTTSALRVDGSWFSRGNWPMPLTGGELGEDFILIRDNAKASTLLAEAKAALSD